MNVRKFVWNSYQMCEQYINFCHYLRVKRQKKRKEKWRGENWYFWCCRLRSKASAGGKNEEKTLSLYRCTLLITRNWGISSFNVVSSIVLVNKISGRLEMNDNERLLFELDNTDLITSLDESVKTFSPSSWNVTRIVWHFYDLSLTMIQIFVQRL